MIEKVRVKGLKSIRDLTVNCSKLNLFVGTNSSGKSTFLQALLIWKQKALNGRYISIGDFREVRNYNLTNKTIRVEIKNEGYEELFYIECNEKTVNVKDPDDYLLFESEKYYAEVRVIGFHYLSCHRLGAADIYAKNISGNSNFGTDGEYALSYLLENESKVIDKKFVVENEKTTDSLLDQVNYWLDYIVGTTLSINDIKKTNYVQVRYNNNPANVNADAMYCRPVNIGSGISYLISIIITCLGAESRSVIIIENPEIHLHPKAQSKLCEFLCFVSKAGQQLFIETHSDHIFNGLRVGVATGKVLPEDISVNFFAMNKNYETQCNPIKFEKYGKIVGTNDEMNINDLFDQFEIDLDRMLGLDS